MSNDKLPNAKLSNDKVSIKSCGNRQIVEYTFFRKFPNYTHIMYVELFHANQPHVV
jgi:hypothetical protein